MIYALIPARVGSKGVPNKNWKPLNGKSCVQRAVECAQAAGISHIWISTDHPRIRPKWASGVRWRIVGAPIHQATTTMVEVITDWERRARITEDDYVVLLQPSSPLRSVDLVDRCAKMLMQWSDGIEPVLSMEPVPIKWHAQYQYTRVPDVRPVVENGPPSVRQLLHQTVRPSGAVYAWKGKIWESWLYSPHVIIDDHPLSIDTPDDWDEAERQLIAIEGDRRGL
jgi:CMP-N-acetylneuraminic acid synthetase